MSSLEFMVAYIMFAPIVGIIVLIVALIVADINHKKQSAYEDKLIRRCIEEKGYAFVERIIRVAKDCNLGKNFIIKSLENELGKLKEEI